MKGNISSRILFGHLLALGFRHSSRGSGFDLGCPFETHLLVEVKKLDCKARLGAWLWEKSSARRARVEGRKGGMVETKESGRDREAMTRTWIQKERMRANSGIYPFWALW